MSNIKDIINVTITRETRSVSQAGFGTILILGENATLKTVLIIIRHWLR